MIFLTNILTLVAMTALGFLFKEIEWTWGADTMGTFCLGWIAATVMWQTVHKMRYGHWFDPPVLSIPDKGPGADVAKGIKR